MVYFSYYWVVMCRVVLIELTWDGDIGDEMMTIGDIYHYSSFCIHSSCHCGAIMVTIILSRLPDTITPYRATCLSDALPQR